MATGSVVTLQAEIRQLEQDLARRRRALEILQQGMGKPTTAPAVRPAVTAGAQPPTTRTVLEKLFTAAPKLRLTSKQIRERLQQRKLFVTPKTIQRQLSALVKAKVIRVQNGQYGLVAKSPATFTPAASKTTSKPEPTTAAAAKPTAAKKTPQRPAGTVTKAIK